VTPETLFDGIVRFNDAAAALGPSSFPLKRWADKPGGPRLIYIGRLPHLNLVKLNVRVVAEPKPVRRGRPRTRP
jgi:hypothetical protein